MKPKLRGEIKSAYQARGWSVRIRPKAANAEQVLGEDFSNPPAALLALLARCDGVEELGTDEHGEEREYKVLFSAREIAAITGYSREVLSPSLRSLILIGGRGQPGQSVYFVMPERSDATQVGIYWVSYDEVEWVCDNLDVFLLGLAQGTLVTDEQLLAIDASSKRAAAGRLRMRKHTEATAKRRERKLAAPLRPGDWRAHILRAFGKGKVRLRPPVQDVPKKLAPLTSRPPRVLIDLLRTTNGIYDRDAYLDVLFRAQDVVTETIDARESYDLSKRLLVIGRLGVDGILFVMREGAESNAVGAYYPMEGKTRWVSKRLSDFLNRSGEGSLLF